jgi:alcohol dehydrogenase
MRALTLVADRKLELIDVPEPPAPGAGEVQIRIAKSQRSAAG